MSSFDVFIKGINPERLDDAAQVKQMACQYLELTPEKLDTVLNAPGQYCFLRGVSEQTAKSYQINLAKIGLICVYRPGGAISDLALVPIDGEENVGTGIFTCPACGQQEPTKEGKALERCPNCGILPEKFIALQKLKAEKAEIKNNLLRSQNAKIAFENKQKQEAAEEKRKQTLEKEVLAELGGWRSKKSQQLLIWTASIVGSLLIGGGSYWLATEVFQDNKTAIPSNVANAQQNTQATNSATANSAGPGDAGMPKGGISMADAHDKANKVLKSFGLNANAMGGSSNSSGAATASGDLSTGPEGINTTNLGDGIAVVHADGSNAPVENNAQRSVNATSERNTVLRPALMQVGNNTPEWDLFLNRQVSMLLNKQALSEALSLSAYIIDHERYLDAIGKLLSVAQKNAQWSLVNDALSAIAERLTTLPTAEQVNYLAQAGYYQQQATGVHSLLERAEKLFMGLTDAQSQLAASLNIAVNYARTGNTEIANRYLKPTTSYLNRIQGDAEQIKARAAIANAYQALDNNDVARKWLSSVTQFNTASTEAYQALMQAYASTQQVSELLATSARIVSSEAQSVALLNSVQTLLHQAASQTVVKVADNIADPFYKALAELHIAAYYPEQITVDKLEVQLNQLPNVAEQAVFAGLLARQAMRLNQEAKAQHFWQQAEQYITTLPNPMQQDTRALLAENMARALQVSSAQQQLLNITTAQLQQRVSSAVTQALHIDALRKSI